MTTPKKTQPATRIIEMTCKTCPERRILEIAVPNCPDCGGGHGFIMDWDCKMCGAANSKMVAP